MAKRLFYILFFTLLIFSCKQKGQSVKEYKPPGFKGIAFVQPRDGNHIAVLNLENGAIGRIVLDKRIQAVSMVSEKKILYIFTSDGFLKRIDLSSAEKGQKWKRIAPAICNADTADGSNLYIITPEEGALSVYSSEQDRIIKKLPLSSQGCNTTVIDSGKEILLVNNKDSSVTVVDKETLSVKERIPNVGNSIHNAVWSPDKKELWVAEGNEYKDGRPYGVGFAKAEAMPGGLNIVDVATRALKDFVMVGGNVEDLKFSSDGRYVFTVSSQMQEYDDAALSIVDVQGMRVVKLYTLCKVCHFRSGIRLEKAFVNSFEIDEQLRPSSIKALLESGFQSTEPGGESVIIKQIYETAE